jgi:hypothetical protein
MNTVILELLVYVKEIRLFWLAPLGFVLLGLIVLALFLEGSDFPPNSYTVLGACVQG